MTLLLILTLIGGTVLTDQETQYLASILAGETVPDCAECDRMIACTLLQDVTRYREAGAGVYDLHPGRWHGWRTPSQRHIEAIQLALAGGCIDIPPCIRLGNLRDYQGWVGGIGRDRPSIIVGNEHGAVVCIPWEAPPSRAVLVCNGSYPE